MSTRHSPYQTYRMPVYRLFRHWGVTVNTNYMELLAHLSGYNDAQVYSNNFDEPEIRICETLMGPHGYSIFRMMLAQRPFEGLYKT